MSNNDSTPAFYGNPFIGLLPADTADNLIYGMALLKSMRPESMDHDEGMGLFRMLDALHGAAHHLRFALKTPEESGVIEIEVPDAERAALAGLARKSGQSIEDYAAGLVTEQIMHRLKPEPA